MVVGKCWGQLPGLRHNFYSSSSMGELKLSNCKGILMLLTIAFYLPALAQPADYFLKSSDEELTMTLSRADYMVKIELTFAHVTQLDYAIIEKSNEPAAGFRQCKYIKLPESGKDSLAIAERDKYPLAATQNVYYRIKTVSKEGVSRTYPVVRLPALATSQ